MYLQIFACHPFPAMGHIPASIGLGQYSSSETDSELIAKADSALYVAKKVAETL